MKSTYKDYAVKFLILPMFFFAGSLLTFSCSNEEQEAPGQAESIKADDKSSEYAAPFEKRKKGALTEGLYSLADKSVEIRYPDGSAAYRFARHKDGQTELFDASGELLATLHFKEGKVKVDGPDGQALFVIKRSKKKVSIKDPSENTVLYKFKSKAETGKWKVYAGEDRQLYTIKGSSSKLSLQNASGQTLYRAKAKEGKVVLRDLSDQTVLSCKAIGQPMAMLFFGMSELSKAQQAAAFALFAAP